MRRLSVVFGMPKVAIEKGGVERVAPLDNIASIAADFFELGGDVERNSRRR